MKREGFFAQFAITSRAALRDKGVLLLLVIAPVIYGFFYPWPYSTEIVQRVPVAVVDMDNSALSRQILRFAAASPRLDIRVMPSELAAREALWRGQIEGYALIPPDLKRDVSRGRPVTVSIIGNGNYFLLNKSVLTGFAEVVGTVSAGIEMRLLAAHGMSYQQANVARNPLELKSAALFNLNEGYGSSLVPAVALLILQQTLLMAGGMLIATWRENGDVRVPTTAAGWAGRLVALALPNTLIGVFFFSWVFIIQGYAHGGNIPGALVLLPVFSLTVAAYACLVGLWMKNRERILQVVLFTALPLFFISGYSWPAEALPWLLRTLRWLSPSTPAIHASVRLNQMGAMLIDVLPLLLGLLMLGGAAFAILCWKGRLRTTAAE